METGDWVISIVIGGVGIFVGFALEHVGLAILREVRGFRCDLESVTDSLERIERLLLDIPQAVVEPNDFSN